MVGRIFGKNVWYEPNKSGKVSDKYDRLTKTLERERDDEWRNAR